MDESEVLGQIGSVFADVLGHDPFGGGTGAYVFADLAELDSVLTQWRAERQTILDRDEKIVKAIEMVAPPADDIMSVGQAEAFTASLQKLKAHNQALYGYAHAYVEKLEAVRASYTAVEDANTTSMTNLNPGT